MRISQRLFRLQARVPPVTPQGDPERGKQIVSEIRACLGGFGIDLDRLIEDMDAKFGQPSSRLQFFIHFGLALAEEPEAKEAVGVLLEKHILSAELSGEST